MLFWYGSHPVNRTLLLRRLLPQPPGSPIGRPQYISTSKKYSARHATSSLRNQKIYHTSGCMQKSGGHDTEGRTATGETPIADPLSPSTGHEKSCKIWGLKSHIARG